MKKVQFTYWLNCENETAETCITLPMKDEIAKDIIEHREESGFLKPGGIVYEAFEKLAAMQGYTFGGALVETKEED